MLTKCQSHVSQRNTHAIQVTKVIVAIVFGIIDILSKMDFYNDFLKYKMS